MIAALQRVQGEMRLAEAPPSLVDQVGEVARSLQVGTMTGAPPQLEAAVLQRLPAARLALPTQDLFRRSGRVARALWAAPNLDQRRALFERWFYPPSHPTPTRLADLGAGYGEFTLLLANRYPLTHVWSSDAESVMGLAGPLATENIIDASGQTFEELVRLVRAPGEKPLLFDRVYAVMPNLVSIGDFVDASLCLVAEHGEAHFLTEALHAADEARLLFEANGFEAVRIEIPREVAPPTGSIRCLGDNQEILYWIAARRRLGTDFFAFPRGNPFRPLPSLRRLRIGHIDIENPRASEVLLMLVSLFRRPLPVEDLLGAFCRGVPRYCLNSLTLSPAGENGRVVVQGVIANDHEEAAGSFELLVPAEPSSGEPWTAQGRSFDSWMRHGRFRILSSKRLGLARTVHQGFLPFLADLGVDRFDATLQGEGSFVFPHLGFDFRSSAVRDRLRREFAVRIDSKRIRLSPEERERFFRIRHAWDLADFTTENGRLIGQEFLLYRGKHVPEGWEGTFHLRRDYPGWRRLFVRSGHDSADATSTGE